MRLSSASSGLHHCICFFYLCWLPSWRWRWRRSTGRRWRRSRSAGASPPDRGCWKTPSWRRSPSETPTSWWSPNLRQEVRFNISVWEEEGRHNKLPKYISVYLKVSEKPGSGCFHVWMCKHIKILINAALISRILSHPFVKAALLSSFNTDLMLLSNRYKEFCLFNFLSTQEVGKCGVA